jgi:hypothetical protein
MPYSYEADYGQRAFLKLRDHVLHLVEKASAVRCQEALRGYTGDTFLGLAIPDRMVELEEI